MLERLIPQIQLKDTPAGQILFNVAQQMKKRMSPKRVPDLPPDMFAKPGRTHRITIAPDAAASTIL
jgi:hypothetical protein